MKKSNIFQGIRGNRPGYNNFDLSHEKKLSTKMARLTPIYLEEVVPGDKIRLSSEVLLRLAPMISPVMHRVNVYTHFFFVPNRLVWENWEKFITGGEDGIDNSVYPPLTMNEATKASFSPRSLSDYFGIPTISEDTVVTETNISALPFRAYQLIYNEFYRDQNMQDKVDVKMDDTVDGTERVAITSMRNRAWEKDYFTSALPWLQKGDPISAPLNINYAEEGQWRNSFGDDTDVEGNIQTDSIGRLQNDGVGGGLGNIENLDLDQSGIDVNDLRKAIRLQRWLERNARAGSRYVESIFAHFGVKSDDLRHMRPQYLGGGKTPVVISEVLQTSQTNTEDGPAVDPSVQGNMAGHGIAIGSSNRFKANIKEHGFIIGIMSILPRSAYQQGLEKLWLMDNKFDFYWPEFAQLGEQEVLSKELFLDTQNPTNDDTFGYQSRYAEYKYKQSSVHGDFKTTLKHWHMGRIFNDLPVLNDDYVTADPTNRIFAVEDQTQDQLYVQIYNNVKAIRPMPYFNDPTL